jgi:hypothetical protein
MALATLSEKEWQKSLQVDLPIALNEVSLQAISDLQQIKHSLVVLLELLI